MIFDAHFHIIDPDFPLVANQGYLPDAFTVSDYQNKLNHLEIVGGAVVSGSFQQFDQTYLVAALCQLGDQFVGVTQLPVTVSDEQIISLHQQGVRAVRFNLYRGGSENIEHLYAFAKRVYELTKWHVELYVDSTQLGEIKNIILSLPKVSIDHLGLSKAGLRDLFALIEAGVYVKTTGPMRVDFEIPQVLRQIYDINPDALMFGTDLPGTRASRQFSMIDLDLIQQTFAHNSKAVGKILYHNAKAFYGV
ncbi:MAG: amidohydrolase family protein [Pseudomonadota bacterium]